MNLKQCEPDTLNNDIIVVIFDKVERPDTFNNDTNETLVIM